MKHQPSPLFEVSRAMQAAVGGAARDERGTFAVAFALMSVPMAILVSMLIDYGENVLIQSRVQSAADSAVLAAARLNDADLNRVSIAQNYFESQLSDKINAMVIRKVFSLSSDNTKITADIELNVPTRFGIGGMTSMPTVARSTAAIARPDVRQLDIVMCIDATGSMWGTINAVKVNALNLESNLNSELESRGIKAFDGMRVRAIYYRDFGGTNLTGTPRSFWNGSSWTTITSSHPDYWRGVGDIPPMKFSSFFDLPDQRTAFNSYVSPEGASGGADLPEAGLECVNEAMDSPWAKSGDLPRGGSHPLDAVYPLIAVWTDAAAHKPGYSVSLKNPDYPPPGKMPRTYSELRAKWDNPTVIDQSRKMLVFFGNPSLNSTDRDGVADGWHQVKTWPGFMVGGTLTEGNSQLVSKLADAIASKVRTPKLTQ